jgi:hypothetical protein
MLYTTLSGAEQLFEIWGSKIEKLNKFRGAKLKK